MLLQGKDKSNGTLDLGTRLINYPVLEVSRLEVRADVPQLEAGG